MENTWTIQDWIDETINGTGGFVSFETHELPIFTNGRDVAIADFVIRALANRKCEGSQEVLNAIINERERR